MSFTEKRKAKFSQLTVMLHSCTLPLGQHPTPGRPALPFRPPLAHQGPARPGQRPPARLSRGLRPHAQARATDGHRAAVHGRDAALPGEVQGRGADRAQEPNRVHRRHVRRPEEGGQE